MALLRALRTWPLHTPGPGDPKANQFGKPEPRSWERMQSILDGLTSTFPLPQIGVAVGTVEEPGPAHENASCSHTWTPPITPVACCNYGWNRSSLKEFIRRVEAAGITELDVWREDLQPPPGQVRHNHSALVCKLERMYETSTYARTRYLTQWLLPVCSFTEYGTSSMVHRRDRSVSESRLRWTC